VATTGIYFNGVPTPDEVETFREVLGFVGSELDVLEGSLRQRYETGPRDRALARVHGQEPPPESAQRPEPMTEAELGRLLYLAHDLRDTAERLTEYSRKIQRHAFYGYDDDHATVTPGYYAGRAHWYETRAKHLRDVDDQRAAGAES